MKEISINQNSSTEKVKFGPVGRDIILNEKIEDETARATNRENELEAQITEAGARVKDVKYNGTSIVVDKVAEIKPSIEASVAVETARATTAEGTLQTNLEIEVNARINAITAEATTRATEDTKLSDRIDSLESRGRFLSTWNATTGKPNTYPTVPEGAEYPYTYLFKPGDYYIINNVPESGTKYKPTGSSITKQTAESEWTIGSAEETESVSNNGSYTFDSTNWVLMGAGAAAAWGSIGGNIADQTDLSNALSAKANDNNVVHLTGQTSQSVAGTLVIADHIETQSGSNASVLGHIHPQDNETYTLGSLGVRWNKVYTKEIANQNISIPVNSIVTTDTAQFIYGTKTFNTDVNFKDSNYWIGSDPSFGFLTISAGNSNRVRINAKSLSSFVDNNTNLGNSEESWKNIYFKGELNANGSAGTSGQVLTSQGPDAPALWQDAAPAPAPSNMVTTDTIQTITGLKTIQTQADGQAIIFTDGSYQHSIYYGSSLTCGTWTFEGKLYPSTNKSYNLGSDSARWGKLYCNGVNTAGSVTPAANGTLYLGSSSWQWKNIYTRGMEIYGGNTTTYPNSPALTFVYNKSDGTTYNNSLTLDSIGSDSLASFRLDGRFSPGADATYSMGYSNLRWKDIYASRNISDGTNSTTVANIAVKSTESTETTGQLKIAVVTALPENPDPNTLYFIKEA